jgi:hypothetical protein
MRLESLWGDIRFAFRIFKCRGFGARVSLVMVSFGVRRSHPLKLAVWLPSEGW